jgi:hypothetical protein
LFLGLVERKTKPTTESVPAFLDLCADDAHIEDAKAPAELMRKVTDYELRLWGTSIDPLSSDHYNYENGPKSGKRRDRQPSLGL